MLQRSSLRAMFIRLRGLTAHYGWVFSLTIVLALVLDITGSLHVYSLDRLLGAPLILGTAALLVVVAIGWLCSTPRLASMAMFSPQLVQRGVTALMLLAWLATLRDFYIFITPAMPLVHIIGFSIGGLLLWFAIIRPPPLTWLIWLAVSLGSLVRVMSFSAIPIEPSRGDMLPLVQGALANFLAGESPYTIYTMPWELPLTYLPITWLAYLPAYSLGVDMRVTSVLAELTIGATLAWIATSRGADAGMQTNQRRLIGTSVGLLVWAWVFCSLRCNTGLRLPLRRSGGLFSQSRWRWSFVAIAGVQQLRSVFVRPRRR